MRSQPLISFTRPLKDLLDEHMQALSWCCIQFWNHCHLPLPWPAQLQILSYHGVDYAEFLGISLSIRVRARHDRHHSQWSVQPPTPSVHRSASTILQLSRSYDVLRGVVDDLCSTQEKNIFDCGPMLIDILRWFTQYICRSSSKIIFRLSSGEKNFTSFFCKYWGLDFV